MCTYFVNLNQWGVQNISVIDVNMIILYETLRRVNSYTEASNSIETMNLMNYDTARICRHGETHDSLARENGAENYIVLCSNIK